MPKFGGPGPRGIPEKAKNFSGTLKNILSYLKPYKVSMIFVILCAIGSTIFSIIGPKILGNVTTEIFSGLIKKINNVGSINFKYISNITLVLVIIYLLSAFFSAIQGVIMSKVSNDVSYRLRNNINKKINKLPIKYFDSKTHGETLSIITNDVDTLSQSITQSITTIISGITTLVGVLLIMISINITMTIVTILIIPLCMFFVSCIVKKSQKYFTMHQEYLGHINGHIEEIYGGHDIVTVFNGQEKAIETFKNLNNTLYHSAWKSQFLSTIMHPIMNFIGNIGYVLISILGGYMTIKERIQVGDILSFTQYVRTFTNQISQIIMKEKQREAMIAEIKFHSFHKL